MWRSKKFILIALLATVVLAGSIGGVVLANEGEEESQPEVQCGAFLDRVCRIYNANPDRPGDIDCDILKAAFAQAQSEIRTEALQNRLQTLVDQEQITQEQADQYLEWWQAKPDVSVGFGFKGHGRLHSMGGMHGFGGHLPPRTT